MYRLWIEQRTCRFSAGGLLQPDSVPRSYLRFDLIGRPRFEEEYVLKAGQNYDTP